MSPTIFLCCYSMLRCTTFRTYVEHRSPILVERALSHALFNVPQKPCVLNGVYIGMRARNHSKASHTYLSKVSPLSNSLPVAPTGVPFHVRISDLCFSKTLPSSFVANAQGKPRRHPPTMILSRARTLFLFPLKTKKRQFSTYSVEPSRTPSPRCTCAIPVVDVNFFMYPPACSRCFFFLICVSCSFQF